MNRQEDACGGCRGGEELVADAKGKVATRKPRAETLRAHRMQVAEGTPPAEQAIVTLHRGAPSKAPALGPQE